MSRAERRVLVISFHYPPDGFVGGLRWSGLTRYLAELGWRCTVLTAAQGESEDRCGVTVHRLPRRTTLNDIYRRARAGRGSENNTAATATSTNGVRAAGRLPSWREWIDRLRLEGGQTLAIPDEGRGWVVRAGRQARRLVRELQPDVVVTSGPPHSAHLAGYLATRGRGVRWVADFRDPWAGPVTDAWLDMPHVRSHVSRFVLGTLERLVVRSADAMVCNTTQMGDFFAKRYPGLRPLWIPNGVDGAGLPPRSAARFEGLSIAYVGTLYGGRDLTAVLDGFARFLATRTSEERRHSILRVAGNVVAADLARLEASAAARGLTANVQYLGSLPRAQALELAGRSHVALVLAQQQELQVPAKLYELVRLGVPTVVVGSADGAAASESRRLGAFAVQPDDVQEIARLLAWISAGGARPAASPNAALDYRDLAPLMSRVLTNGGGPA